MKTKYRVLIPLGNLATQQKTRLQLKLLPLGGQGHMIQDGDDLVVETSDPLKLGHILGELGITSYSELGPNSSLD